MKFETPEVRGTESHNPPVTMSTKPAIIIKSSDCAIAGKEEYLRVLEWAAKIKVLDLGLAKVDTPRSSTFLCLAKLVELH